MAHFDSDNIPVIQQAIPTFREWLRYNVTGFFERASVGQNLKMPSAWKAIESDTQALEIASQQGGVGGLEMEDAHLPLLKRAFIVRRRIEAERIHRLQEQVHHLEVLESLDKALILIDRMFALAQFKNTKPRELPRATDLIPIQKVEEFAGGLNRLQQRTYDEKFHILQAPDLFLPDLAAYRGITDLRGTCTSVAFMDIDNFKTFNTAHTETKIDRNMLPRFMQLVESHVYMHGHAYRQGGDEYLFILPGFSPEFAINFLDELRIKISKLTYPGIDKPATVSIGMCFADPDCHLTDRELREKANVAKERAKGTKDEKEKGIGKNRIAAFMGDGFTEADLRVVRAD
jgi:diguanylate cyclase (GGDEF)-like protein